MDNLCSCTILAILSSLLPGVSKVTAGSANFSLHTDTLEDMVLTTLVENLMDTIYSDCSFGFDTEFQSTSPSLQAYFKKHESNYRPLVTTRMDLAFSVVHTDYPEIWKEEQLYSFRTMPVKLRSDLWNGVKCALNLLIADSPDTFPKLMLHAATSFWIRNNYDPVLIHVRSGSEAAPMLLLQPPGDGINFKMVSHFTGSNLTLYTTCYFCQAGVHTVNPPMTYPKYEAYRYFPGATLNFNGSNIIIAHVEDVDMESGRRTTTMSSLTYEQYYMLQLEQVMNARVTIVVPELRMEETYPNGTHCGITGAVVYKEAYLSLVTLYTDISVMANLLPYPIIYFHVSFATRHPRPDIKWYIIFQPYTSKVWACIATTVLISALTIYCLEKVDQDAGSFLSYLQCLKAAIRELVEQPAGHPYTIPTMVFCVFFFLFCITISCGYKAKLVAFLTYPEMEILPDYIRELAGSNMAYGSPLFFKTLIAMFVARADDAVLDSLMGSLEVTASIKSCLEEALSHDFACVIPDYYYNRDNNIFIDEQGNLKLRWAPDKTYNLYTGPAFGRDEVLFAKVVPLLLRVFEASILTERQDVFNHFKFLSYYHEMRRMAKGEEKEEKRREILTLGKIVFVIVVWVIGIAASVIGFVVEMVVHAQQVRSEKRDHPYTFLV